VPNRVLGSMARRFVPRPLRLWLLRQTLRPRPGTVDFGGLRRLKPVSRAWGEERGEPIDRYYIRRFVADHADDIRGAVLEFGDATYTRRFGGDRVQSYGIFDVSSDNPSATLIGDLADAERLPRSEFDAILCLQTLQFLADREVASNALERMLRAGGVLLVTVPGIAQVVVADRNPWTDYGRFTEAGLLRHMGVAFPGAEIEVKAYGNVLSSISFLHGIAAEELTADELDHHDPQYPLLVCARVVKR
jgi:SAM-dependent methyltransferase